VTQRRTFPLDDAARELRRDAADADARTAATSASRRTWPVLARIGDVHRSGDPATTTPDVIAPREAKPAPEASQRIFRVDSPHVTVVSDTNNNQGAALPQPKVDEAQNPKALPTKQRRYLHRLPGIIRFAIRTWLMLHPYRSLIRAAAMFVLMGITGASTVIMMGDDLRPDATPPNNASAAAEHAMPQDTTAPASGLTPEEGAASPPEAIAAPAPPTALGPNSFGRRELVAVEKNREKKRRKKSAATAVDEADTDMPVVAYPTTSFPVVTYPTTLPIGAPPTSVPPAIAPTMEVVAPPTGPAAVAQLQGTIESMPPTIAR
jgi:hypothetical protein